MAGYVRPPIELVFEQEEFDGLRVWSKRVSLNRIFELQELAEQVGADDDGPDAVLDPDDDGNWFEDPDTGRRRLMRPLEKKLRALFGALVPCLLAWNLQESGDPRDPDAARTDVPLSVDGMCSQDPPFALSIVEALIDANTGVPDPLDGGSPNGATPGEIDALAALG